MLDTQLLISNQSYIYQASRPPYLCVVKFNYF